MCLLDTDTGQFVDKDPESRKTVYAILSHTWDTNQGEQTYKELERIQQRYGHGRGSQTPQTWHPASGSELHTSSHPERSGPSPSSPPSPLPNSSPSVTILPLTALGRLAQSAVEALCTFVEAYGFVDADLGTPAPIPICPSVTDPEPPSKPPPQCIWDDPELSPKIQDACRVARENGYRYIWIDSCCIDKSSSSELSEAINSMYRWYALARVCYAYLADVPLEEDPHARGSAFCQSRWFQRGWTLQELIAPAHVEFLSKDWSHIGSKHTLADLVEGITAIHYAALLHLKHHML